MATLNCGQNKKSDKVSYSTFANLVGDSSYYAVLAQQAQDGAAARAEAAVAGYIQMNRCPDKCGIGFPLVSYEVLPVDTILHVQPNPVHKPGVPGVPTEVGQLELKVTVQWTVSVTCYDTQEWFDTNVKPKLHL